MKCPICDKDFDSVDCEHWGPDLIKEIERLNEYIFNLDKTAEKHRANFEKIHHAIHKGRAYIEENCEGKCDHHIKLDAILAGKKS